MLQQFAQVLPQLVRDGDYVVRWGGEEFLLVFRPMPARLRAQCSASASAARRRACRSTLGRTARCCT